VTTKKRYAELPDVPTLDEAGVKGYDATVWLGLLAPPGTPRDIVDKLNTSITKILSTPDARKLMASAGVDVATSSPEEFATLMQSELERWGKVVRATGATVELTSQSLTQVTGGWRRSTIWDCCACCSTKRMFCCTASM
jgi:tripartite-type tricarboxylate transporter receptor subunit TctC